MNLMKDLNLTHACRTFVIYVLISEMELNYVFIIDVVQEDEIHFRGLCMK